jgi:hypothetical protein
VDPVACLDVSFSDFQFFSFPARIGVVKNLAPTRRTDIPLSPDYKKRAASAKRCCPVL